MNVGEEEAISKTASEIVKTAVDFGEEEAISKTASEIVKTAVENAVAEMQGDGVYHMSSLFRGGLSSFDIDEMIEKAPRQDVHVVRSLPAVMTEKTKNKSASQVALVNERSRKNRIRLHGGENVPATEWLRGYLRTTETPTSSKTGGEERSRVSNRCTKPAHSFQEIFPGTKARELKTESAQTEVNPKMKRSNVRRQRGHTVNV
ncbi:hypothetical protein ScPMuIL_003988 [Solemya velum]